MGFRIWLRLWGFKISRGTYAQAQEFRPRVGASLEESKFKIPVNQRFTGGCRAPQGVWRFLCGTLHPFFMLLAEGGCCGVCG